MSIIQIQVNSEYEKLVPPVPLEEYKQLKNSILNNGLYLPIIVNEKGIVLDGHHRFRACKELGVNPKTQTKTFDDPLLEKRFVILVNLDRRHLKDFQRAELGVPLLEIESQLSKEKKISSLKRGNKSPLESNGPNGKATERVSKTIGLSTKTLERAKKIIETAPEEVKEKLRHGETSISKEYQNIVKQEKKEQRQSEIKKLQVNLPKSIQLFNNPFQDNKIKDNSVSLIFTDPPYAEKDLYLYQDLAKQAARVLRDGGSLMCYVGHFCIDRVMDYMKAEGLRYHWPIAVIHSGPSASVFGRKILVGYKPILWFTKGKYQGEFVKDTIKSEFQGKELHEWAQSTVESDYYIEFMTIPNEIVYDPFLGQGTFGVSAAKLKRQFIGSEVNKEHFENARRLISNAGQS